MVLIKNRKSQKGKRGVAPVLKPREGYNLVQQLTISAIVCTLAILSFLPYMLNMELYDDDPDTPYSGGADDVLIDIVNAVGVSCLSMMFLEALLDSSSLYIPIKIAFPRFIMVFGVLCTCLGLLTQQSDGLDRLNFLVCSHYAKAYFLCGGISIRLLRDAADRGSFVLSIYLFGVTLYTTDILMLQWSVYFAMSKSFVIMHNCVTVATLLLGLYFAFRAVQLFMSHNVGGAGIGHHYYDVMSHVVICLFMFMGTTINMAFGFQPWKDTTAEEIAAYNFVGLFVIVLFFFTSSYIAQRHFVMAKVSILYMCVILLLRCGMCC